MKGMLVQNENALFHFTSPPPLVSHHSLACPHEANEDRLHPPDSRHRETGWHPCIPSASAVPQLPCSALPTFSSILVTVLQAGCF